MDSATISSVVTKKTTSSNILMERSSNTYLHMRISSAEKWNESNAAFFRTKKKIRAL